MRYDSVETLLDSDHVPVSGAVALRVGQNAPRGSMGGATMPFLPQAEILAPFSQSPLMRFLVTQGVLRAFPKEKLAPILELLDVTYIRGNSVILRPSEGRDASLLVVIRGEVSLLAGRFPLRQVAAGEWFGGEALLGEKSGVTAVSCGDTVCVSVNEASGGVSGV